MPVGFLTRREEFHKSSRTAGDFSGDKDPRIANRHPKGGGQLPRTAVTRCRKKVCSNTKKYEQIHNPLNVHALHDVCMPSIACSKQAELCQAQDFFVSVCGNISICQYCYCEPATAEVAPELLQEPRVDNLHTMPPPCSGTHGAAPMTAEGSAFLYRPGTCLGVPQRAAPSHELVSSQSPKGHE